MKDDDFMQTFKYFKSNQPKPSLLNVLSVEDDRFTDKFLTVSSNHNYDARTESLGLKMCNKWKTYSFIQHPGLFLIRNPFTSLGQRYWIRKCLEEFPRKPNKTNLDNEVVLEDWWQSCYEGRHCDTNLLKKLRWTTMGYHHNWDTKQYSEENHTPFPDDLAELSDVVAQYLGHCVFRAEAAIVNYYHMKSTLSAHTDHSEVNIEAPLVSFSFGQSAIFLIGGTDKSKTPSAILLQSGDIMIMSKEARLCYHAVPKILPSRSSPWNEDSIVIDNDITPTFKYIKNQQELCRNMNRNVTNDEWREFNNYIEQSRTNMNVRQVLSESQSSLTDAVFSAT